MTKKIKSEPEAPYFDPELKAAPADMELPEKTSFRAAIVERGVVINVVMVTGKHAAWVVCPDEVGPGWLYNGKKFSAPE